MLILMWQVVYKSVLVGIASYVLHYWAYSKGVDEVNGVIKRPAKHDKETGKKQDRKTGHHVLDRWLSFGGGYYGTVAFLTFVIIELTQFLAFISDVDGMIAYFKNFGISSIIAFFIDQIQNFIQAVIWPVGYLGDYSWISLAILFAATYYAYLGAKKAAKTYV